MRARLDWVTEYAPFNLARLRRLNKAAIFRTALGVLVAALLLVIFSRLISFGSVLRRLEHINIVLALLCGLVFLAAYVVRALRWRYFLRPNYVSKRDVILIYQVSIFVNWLLPVRGGEIVKVFLLRRRTGIPVSDSLPSVAMDKLMDLLPALVLLVILPFLPFHMGDVLWGLLLFVAGIFVVCIAFLMIAVWKREVALRLLYRLFALTPAVVRQKVEPFVERFLDALLRLAAQPHLLLIASGYTAVAVSLDALFAWLAFQAIGSPISYAIVLFGYTLYNLAYILPTPPGQIGSNEVLGLLVFSGIFHVARLSVATMFVFSHPWTALLMIVAGLASLSALGIGLRSTLSLGRHSAKEAPPAESAESAESAEQRGEVGAPTATAEPAASPDR